MRIEHFNYLLGNEYDAFYLTEKLMIFKKPLSFYNAETNEEVRFKNVDELLLFTVNGETLKEMILKLEKPYTPPRNGGRGAGSGNDKMNSWKSAKGGGGGDGEEEEGSRLVPAMANVKIKSKSLEGALKEFKKNHLLADREFAYEVDERGYVHQYKRGDSSSVAISGRAKLRKGERVMIIHNHPNGSAFSPADMLTTAANKKEKGIIASGKKYDYKFEKGSHFNAAGFIKAVKQAERKGLPGKDVNDAVDKFLRKNAKKYGYTYSRRKN